MSLINQMLQDLDARRAAHGVGTSMPNDVRPLPQRQASRWPVILVAFAVLALAGGLAFYRWQEMQTPAQSAAAVTPPALASAVKPPLPEPSVSAANPTLQPFEGSLRMADFIGKPPEKKTGVKPVVPPVAVEVPQVGERTSAEIPVKPDPVKPSTATPAGEAVPGQAKSTRSASIERTDAVGSPRERVEIEYRKSIANVNQGRVVEALENLRNALRQDSLHVASRQLLVKLLLEARQSDEAVQVLHEGLQLQPQQIGWAMSLGRLQVDRGDLAGAWQTLNHSLPAAAGNADYQGFSAHVLQRLGRNGDAVEHYQAAARLAPGDGRWWLGLGLVLETEGRSSEARASFLRARQGGNLSAELAALIEQKLK